MLYLILGLILGAIAFVLREFNAVTDVKFMDFITKKRNYLPALLNLLTGTILLIAAHTDPSALAAIGITKVTFLTAAIFGFTANGLWTALTEGTTKDVKTRIGRNHKK